MELIAVIFGSIVLLMSGLAVAVGAYLLWSAFAMSLFRKAGVQGAWRAWVPFYSQMIFLKLGDVNPFLFLFVLVGWIDVLAPIVNLFVWVMMCLAAYRIGLKLQKESWWVVLFAIPPITFVWLGIVALDGSRWDPRVPPAAWAGNGFLADRTAWEGVPAQATAAPAAYAHAHAQPGYAPQPSPQPGYAAQPHPGAPADPLVPPRPADAPGPNRPPAASDPLAPPQPPTPPPTTPPPFDPPAPPTTPQNPPS
ncbi:hypothetical protein [Microbacterium sediminis]|uniref:Uncharacterized protein n=1 Tax=Microbacterium sediminis TaxID=904291 RepID=A0A1B9NCI3_9MICO|nr:hypothetical protein [Microbacterium sediminis]OCG74309.1 hypothetical protein A7J15_05575 [Microbacterium sediminis]QBR73673.1 large exoprotein [Microbacterium sediminis]